MTGEKRPAAYIRVTSGDPVALLAQRSAICEAARARGWAEPAVYVDDSLERPARNPRGEGRELARLMAAVSTGQHDALLVGLGTICGLRGDMAGLLASCARHGVAVECVTPAAAAAAASAHREPPPYPPT